MNVIFKSKAIPDFFYFSQLFVADAPIEKTSNLGVNSAIEDMIYKMQKTKI